MIARVAPPANSLEPAGRAQWRAWLERNHDRTQGVWLILTRTGGKSKLARDAAVVGRREVPQDLARALDAIGGAENFHSFPPSARRRSSPGSMPPSGRPPAPRAWRRPRGSRR